MEYTEEQRDDFGRRAAVFQDELNKLKATYQCELVHAPTFLPVAAGMFVIGVNESVGDTKFKKIEEPPAMGSTAAPIIAP